jgi:hypothetical protein
MVRFLPRLFILAALICVVGIAMSLDEHIGPMWFVIGLLAGSSQVRLGGRGCGGTGFG